jgi:hypothetical protein
MNSSSNTVEYLSTLLQQQKQAVIALKQIWSNVMPDAPVPGDNSFYLWLQLHDIKVIIKGITQTAKKWGQSVKLHEYQEDDNLDPKQIMDVVDLTKYASAVMNKEDKING